LGGYREGRWRGFPVGRTVRAVHWFGKGNRINARWGLAVMSPGLAPSRRGATDGRWRRGRRRLPSQPDPRV